MNDGNHPFGSVPLPDATAQERQQAVCESWRLDETRARFEEERARQRDEWARQEQEHRLAERLQAVAARHDQEDDRTTTAAGGFFEFLRHHWAVLQQFGSGAARLGRRR